ncbi:MAG: efflux RND transporter periplasmic adaptor subunit [Oligosphaeraceae bacterium]
MARLPLAFALSLLLALLGASCRRNGPGAGQELYSVTRGALDITVLASGSVETARSTNILQKVGKPAKIVTIVPEGTLVTEEDVAKGTVLVQFDAKDMEDQLYERQTAYENAEASAVTAEETLAIQISDNESNIRKAELEVLYAHSDLRKLVGDRLAATFSDQEPRDIPALLNHPDLDGTAKLNLTTYLSDIELAQTKLNRAEQTLEYTRKLYEKQFVSKNDFENDQLDVQSQTKSLEATRGKYEIFRRFDFEKDFQKAWATWQESRRSLERAQANAKIRLTTAESKLRTARQTLAQARKRLEEAQEALKNCTITATMTGMVVYPKLPRWDTSGPIQPGKEIRNEQVVFTLPDLSQMQVKVSIPEAQIDVLEVAQTARITLDALPGKTFSGKLSSKGILPSAEDEWLNPDTKVYTVKIDFDESGSHLRPGMTATVEILIRRLEDVLFVPIQAVQTDGEGRHRCILASGESRLVSLGERNRSFVEVRQGLEAGEQILMCPPEASGEREEAAGGEEPAP